MYIQVLSLLFGIAFVFVGIAGFMPTFTMDGYLFGLFMVNMLHNLVHIMSGVIGILAAFKFIYAKWYFRILGIVYILVMILGFIRSEILHTIGLHMNLADNFLHLLIALVALYLGWAVRIRN
ncbi:MAG: hypothetical protein A3E83_02385 [Gammaproteobacteria bacterium RIFCSPHIGHO2_12_FULL_41_20]|nr:MAG: hypothetical protein A3E83_02385 [Gammaproteobacteria bacterium RIFCSPHIGHO2_12_FULL_41_20]